LIRLLWTAVCCDGVVCMIFMSLTLHYRSFLFFFFNDTATTEIYTLSLHDALPISRPERVGEGHEQRGAGVRARAVGQDDAVAAGCHDLTRCDGRGRGGGSACTGAPGRANAPGPPPSPRGRSSAPRGPRPRRARCRGVP